MADHQRKPMWLYQKHWDLLYAAANEEDRSTSWVIRRLLDTIMQLAENTGVEPVCVLGAPNVHLTCTRGAPEVPTPDPACAPESSTQVVVVEDTTTGRSSDGNLQRIAALFTDLDWRDARLPKDLTPLMYAAQLVEMFPDKNLVTEIQRAQIWHLDRKPSWKRLAHSLNGWLAKPTPEWEQPVQQSMFPHQGKRQADDQDYTTGVDPKTGRW